MTGGPVALARCGAVAATILVLAACADSPVANTGPKFDVGTPRLDIHNPPIVSTSHVFAEEKLLVCKVFSGSTSGYPSASFSAVLTGTYNVTVNFSLNDGECADLGDFGGTGVDVTVTETAIPNYTTSWTRQVLSFEGGVGTLGPISAPTSGYVATGSAYGGRPAGTPPAIGTRFVFTNAYVPPPPPPGVGRMTGGGFTANGLRVTGGFTVHCDITLSNNIEINWGRNKWHLSKPITKATCLDDPNIAQKPPRAPLDTFIGEGMGRLNGVEGSKIFFTFIDGGEPGRKDQVQIRIIAPDGVTTALDLPLSFLDRGNIQAHYDQPHGNKP